MNKENETRRLWAWHLSALFYEWAYINVAHQTDDDIFAYLGSRTTGTTVVDCGCGPGVVTEKFLRAGAAKVVAIDANAGMLGKAKSRLNDAIAKGHVLLQQTSHEGQTLARLCQQELGGKGFDVILFKRSLYMPRPRALETLRCAVSTLSKEGMIIVVHPERSLLRYAFAPPFGLTSYTLFHLGNRVASRFAEWCGMEEYTLYSRHELVALLQEAVPDAKIELIPSQQRPYNLVALQAP
ncbi:MAG: class I SAM-dependent methyltransferase [bacterium]|nr:class I SAM-dependent methyltransferase [bacterium]